MKYRELVKIIENEGWQHVRTKGSHRIYQHDQKQGIVVLAPHSLGADVPVGILRAVLKQAGIEQ
ncbi:MAG TPA: type II toxin-antitoxin system HicA family toxin [Alloacidobacterium sp.]|nr:type II toxin-antitoxin system HicA family toxin [Alloacidobacterium sp.]